MGPGWPDPGTYVAACAAGASACVPVPGNPHDLHCASCRPKVSQAITVSSMQHDRACVDTICGAAPSSDQAQSATGHGHDSSACMLELTRESMDRAGSRLRRAGLALRWCAVCSASSRLRRNSWASLCLLSPQAGSTAAAWSRNLHTVLGLCAASCWRDVCRVQSPCCCHAKTQGAPHGLAKGCNAYTQQLCRRQAVPTRVDTHTSPCR